MSSGIVINTFMEKTKDGKLFGKVGFQTMSPKTDRIVLDNLSTIEGYLDKGLLKDLDNKVVDDNAVIMFYGLVTRAKDPADLQHVTSFIDSTGKSIEVPRDDEPDASQKGDEEEVPF